MGFLLRTTITALGLWLATALVPGVEIGETRTLIFAAIMLGVVNAVVRPIAVFLTFPLTLLTLGLFLWVVNAGMFGLTAWLFDDFSVSGFFAALLGSAVVGFTGWLGASFIGENGRYEVMVVRAERRG